MVRFASIVAKSPLIQLDRKFDYVVPEDLEDQIALGQLVSFPFGRTKKPQEGYVVELMDASDYATSKLLAIKDSSCLLTPQLAEFTRAVADRQCVALGEILAVAIPDHMPTIEMLEPISYRAISSTPAFKLDAPLTNRSAVLSSGKPLVVDEKLFADWAVLLVEAALERHAARQSSIIVVPERSDIDAITDYCKHLGVSDQCVVLMPNQKRSTKFQLHHQIAQSEVSIVIGTRSAIYSPCQNLGLIGLHDDADDSLRDQGSPFTNARDLALIRAGDSLQLVLTAPYRSTEVQRLVQLGYLSSHKLVQSPARISYTEPGLRMDQSAFQLIKDQLPIGPVLVLLPRKGDSAAAFCGGCGQKLACSCGGYFWQPDADHIQCRVCSKPFVSCTNCQSRNFKKGRTGSSRTVAELGKAFPNALISEATGSKKPSGLKNKNQIVVATPGSAPRLPGGYSGLLILDCDVWLARQSLNAQGLAIRDWQEAIELMQPSGRAVLSGLDSTLGKALSLGQLEALAATSLAEAKEMSLPPTVRICTLEAEPQTLNTALEAAKSEGAELLRLDAEGSRALIRFGYRQGPAVAKALRGVSVGTTARTVNNSKRRGLRVVMDDPDAL